MHLWQLFVENPLVTAALSVSAALGALAGGPRIYNAIRELIDRRKAKALAAALAQRAGVASFTAEDISRSIDKYIEPYCSQTDPSDEADLRNVVALAPLFKTIDDHIQLGGERRHLILLADSGMGKTTFCMNYFSREQAKKASVRRRVAIVPLGRSNSVEQLRRIEDKSDTIVFLDAFDEDPIALQDKNARLVDLMKVCGDFKNVIVTCRSQFFSKDDDIPKGSGIMYAAPRRAGQGREYPLHKLFLAPLSPSQIEKYLARNFPLFAASANFHRRRSARLLVKSIPELSVRPMLLELIPDLVRERRIISELFGLYEYLVQKWLERESDWIKTEDLFEISIELAIVIYLRDRNGQGDRISPEFLEGIADAHSHPLESWKLKSRSLLNRDIHGEYKFAHRSVMEYLYVVGAVKGDARCLSVEWTDLMKDLFVSWGNTASPETELRLEALLARDLKATKLLPLASPLRSPRRLSSSEPLQLLNRQNVSARHSRSIPLSWRNVSLAVEDWGEHLSSHAYEIFDPTNGLKWEVRDTYGITDTDEMDLYRETYVGTEFDPQMIHYANRLPSIEEMLSLWESEPYLRTRWGIGCVLNPEELYWLGDTTDSGPLCCSFGAAPIDNRNLRPLGARSHMDGRKMHLYQFAGHYGRVDGKAHKAISLRVVAENEG